MNFIRTLTLVLTALWAGSVHAAAQSDSARLRVGQWVKIKGQLDKSGNFIADEMEVMVPDDKESLTGTVERIIDRETFTLLAQQTRITAKTEWKDASLGDLVGARVRVQGHYRGGRVFDARQIALRGSGRDSIEGRIDVLELDGVFVRLTVMGFYVQVGPDVDVEHEAPLDTIPLADVRVVRQIDLARNEDKEVAGRIKLGDTLTLGGQVELKAERRNDDDLNSNVPDDRKDYDLNLRLEALWTPRDDFFALASARLTNSWRLDEDNPDSQDSNVTLSEGYGYWSGAFGWGWDLQVGRQDFDERREWLYDQNLDAVRLIRSVPDYRLELSASTTLSDGNTTDEDSLNLMAYLTNNSSRRLLGAYVIDRSDKDDFSMRATHIGARGYGEWLPQNQSWFEVSGLIGNNGVEDLGGFGLDLGTTWLAEIDYMPALTVGWAWGSGDKEPMSGNDGTFRQTGFQDNNGKWSGVTSFRYYGELVDPELANLSIITLGLGKRINRSNSIDLVWHRFDQVEPAASLINTDLRSAPDGVNTYLGWEADLIFGSRAIRYTLIELVLGYFEPGDAFPGADAALLGRIQLRYRF